MLQSVVKIAPLPKNPSYPKNLETLGDHIRKKRLDLHLEQKDVARILKVSIGTVVNWENNKREPVDEHYPAIMDFLGYCPYQTFKTYGEHLRLFRIHRGLSRAKLAKIIKVDPSSISRWEETDHIPYFHLQRKIEDFKSNEKENLSNRTFRKW